MIFVDGFGELAFEILEKFPFVKGITTNPTILKKSNASFSEAVRVLENIKGMHFIQGSLRNIEWMEVLKSVKREKFVIKLPWDSRTAPKIAEKLTVLGFRFCATAVYKPSQVMSAKYSGASFVAVYYNRMIESNLNPADLIKFALEKDMKVLVASLKTPHQIEEVLKVGDVSVTLPPHVFLEFFTPYFPENDLTRFEEDFKL